jgi:hypothetical protein
LTASLLAVAMLGAWAAGWYRGHYLRKSGQETRPSKLDDAVVALLGLLLAFTFSLALTEHEQRRQMLVADSNAIGDFYTCASLLKEPVRGKLQEVLRRYVAHRLSLMEAPPDEESLQRGLGEVQVMHDQMQSLVREAADAGTPVVVPLVNTLNEVTSSHAARLAAGRARLPESVVLLLFLASLAAMALAGRHPGVAGAPRLGAAVGFTLLVCMVVWVILDLNQPQRGWITINQEPLRRLLTGMGK